MNALAAAVRSGIKDGVDAFGKDPNIDAIVLIGGGRTFIAGADIREFGKPPLGDRLDVDRHFLGDAREMLDRARRRRRHFLVGIVEDSEIVFGDRARLRIAPLALGVVV